MGPMIQQMQTTCSACKGEGTTIGEKDKCGACFANRVTQEKKILEVHVEKGMKHNDKITFNREGDQHPDIKIPGDVVIVLQEKKHDRFERQGQNLGMSKTITLKEALCGFSFPVQHLDGRVLLVKTQPGEIIKPNTTKAIPGEGMPKHRNPFDKGALLIQFTIQMPETLPQATLDILSKVLPSPDRMEQDYDAELAEECYLHDHIPSANQQRQNSRNQYDEDDEDDGPGQRAQCVHQ
jgi:DnaJ family protein A protein 2